MVMVKQSLAVGVIDSFEADALAQLGFEFRYNGDEVRLVSHGYRGSDALVFHAGRLRFEGDPREFAARIEEQYPSDLCPGWIEVLRAHCTEREVTGCHGFEVHIGELGIGIADILRGILVVSPLSSPDRKLDLPGFLDIVYVGIADANGCEAARMLAERVYPDGVVTTTDDTALLAQEASRKLVTAYARGAENQHVDWEDVDVAYHYAAAAVAEEEADG